MQCSSCGTQLPGGAAYCPVCATLTPYGISQSKATPDGPTSVSSPSYPPPPPITPITDYGSPPYGVPPQNPYEPHNPYTAPSAPPPPANPRRKPNNKVLLIASIVAALVIVIGGVIGLAIVHNANQVTATPTPTATPVPYPALSSAYSGSVHNTTYNQNANMVLTSIVQNADKINGNVRFGLPLVGSGSFTGTVSRTNTIQFVVSSGDMGGVTLTFNGSIPAPGSMNGTYTISNGQRGTWKAASATSPVAYPLLYANYKGNLHNNSTNKDATISLAIVTQDQQSFTGLYDNAISLNGTFGDKNSLQFTVTDNNGVPIVFKGTDNVDGSLSGTYLANNGVTGTWKVLPG